MRTTNRLAMPHHFDVCHQHTDPSPHRITEHIIELCDAKSRNILGRFDCHRHHNRNNQHPLLLKPSIQPRSKRNEQPDVIDDPNSHRLLFQEVPSVGKEDKICPCIPCLAEHQCFIKDEYYIRSRQKDTHSLRQQQYQQTDNTSRNDNHKRKSVQDIVHTQHDITVFVKQQIHLSASLDAMLPFGQDHWIAICIEIHISVRCTIPVVSTLHNRITSIRWCWITVCAEIGYLADTTLLISLI